MNLIFIDFSKPWVIHGWWGSDFFGFISIRGKQISSAYENSLRNVLYDLLGSSDVYNSVQLICVRLSRSFWLLASEKIRIIEERQLFVAVWWYLPQIAKQGRS